MPGIIGSILAKLSRIFSKSTPGILNAGSGCGIAVALSSGGVTLPEPIKLPSDPIISVGLMPGPKPKSCGGIGLWPPPIGPKTPGGKVDPAVPRLPIRLPASS